MGKQGAPDFGHEMMHVGETFQARQFGDPDAAQAADAAEVVAQKIDNHQVFRLIFFAVHQFPSQRLVVVRCAAPRTGALYGSGHGIPLSVEA